MSQIPEKKQHYEAKVKRSFDFIANKLKGISKSRFSIPGRHPSRQEGHGRTK